ncbi:MAG TPA: hypothetical protein VFN68_17125, partial [Acidimicrobiales bacterium]|nr:hypothetical protein [Acidimicrobiales bacterium]
VVTDHGGSVSVSVPQEGGTLVHIELPIVTEVEAESGDQPDAGPDGPGHAVSPPPPAPHGPDGEVAWSAPSRHG